MYKTFLIKFHVLLIPFVLYFYSCFPMVRIFGANGKSFLTKSGCLPSAEGHDGQKERT